MDLQCFIAKVIGRGVRAYYASEEGGNDDNSLITSPAAGLSHNSTAVSHPPTRVSSHPYDGSLLFRYVDESGEPGGRPCMLDMAVPTTVYDAKSGGINDECPICIEVFAPNHAVRTFPCGHVIHESCSKTWFLSASSATSSMVCPVCRQNWCEPVVV